MLLVICWYSANYDDLFISEFNIDNESDIENVLSKFKKYRLKQEFQTEYDETLFNENFVLKYKLYKNI